MMIWYLSKEFNLTITGFNKVVKRGIPELWVTEFRGNSRKIAQGKQADDLEKALLDMIWSNFPTIIADGNGNFGSNLNPNVEEEVEE